MHARTVLWTAGVAAPPLADALARATGAEQADDGRRRVRPDLTLPGHPEVYVAGDLMSLDGLPGVAEAAMQAGLHVAGQVLHAVDHPDGVPRRDGPSATATSAAPPTSAVDTPCWRSGPSGCPGSPAGSPGA